MTNSSNLDGFNILQHPQGVVEIAVNLPSNQALSLAHIKNFFSLADSWISRDHVSALCYSIDGKNAAINPDYITLVEQAKDEQSFRSDLDRIDQLIQKIRIYNKPLIAILRGDCVGIYFAWTLIADYRLALGENVRVGFPETAFGMLPSLGSVTRMIQLWGEDFAFRIATQSTLQTIPEAVSLGIIDRQVENKEDALIILVDYVQHLKAIPQQTASAIQEHQKILATPRINPLFAGVEAYQALILKSQDGLDDYALRQLEHDMYINTTLSDQVVTMLRTNYYGMRSAKERIKQIAENTSREMTKIGVIGAGMMGSGIAYEGARAGLDVTLVDTDLDKAEHGKNYAQKVTDKLVCLNKMTVSEQKALVQRIHASEQFEDLKSADILIEAVFEDIALKTKLIADISPNLAAQTVFASNTTSLPIGQLAQSSQNPASFIGLHFFSPVDRMPLVEVILGKKTDQSTINAALKIIHLLNKIPIVVQDGPGFYTSRIFFNYLLEGITMVLEGIPASMVEKAAKKAGFPVGPLLVLDEISLPLMLHVYDQLPALHEAQEAAYAHLKKMIAAGKTGRKGKAGFYPYDENGKRGEVVDETTASNAANIDLDILGKRLLHVVALDAFRCLSDGIIAQPIDGDIGSVLGIGYAPHTGGVFAHIDQVGLAKFVSECDEFASHGAQWQIPNALRDLAAQDYRFYDGFQSNWNPS
ncbi:3-hydroxyacyl-CoA dehydrogenase NAD-binding domain-containing protein [Sphingobacterium chungjuense]|uniref:3-hydroxyacyl-CoA dehydrogenase NAD-binding domain-containing protein n=1 Tax=Sphingobacterium chungjuense TaxID=2675553 RepID=UPI00140BFEC5|nr:3-hydroxyacyl-CoA dehydrogenase NAD-binding domain-containing protein [Sphingobacterium chungjuense]